MKKRDTMKASLVLELVAKKHGVSVDEVRREISVALLAGRNSKDPAVQKKWDAIFPAGEASAEEAIAILAEHIRRN